MKGIRRKLLFSVVLAVLSLMLLLFVQSSYAAILHVGGGHAYSAIQAAIDVSFDGDTVIVHDGIYIENIDFNGKTIIVRSEHGPGATIIDANSYLHVVNIVSGEGAGSVLDGFTITNGATYYGGGIYIVSSSPTISNCIIKDNRAFYYGAGIYCKDNAAPTISNCIITNNQITQPNSGGGGIAGFTNSSVQIINSVISNNNASNGGGIYLKESLSTISSSTIKNNFTDNTNNDGNGGGIYSENSSSIINNSIIRENWALRGGGAYNKSTSTSLITINKFINTFIVDNSAKYGGGLYWNTSANVDDSLSITNSTISNNSANMTTSGGIHFSNSAIEVVNSILWGDTARGNPQEIYQTSGTIDITFSDIDGGHIGTGNVNIAPLFADPTDYHLSVNSPCLDMGTGDILTYPDLPADDVDGDSRPHGPGYDMGADEFYCAGDADSDTICDSEDNCPNIPNVDQSDIDGDSVGDVCDY